MSSGPVSAGKRLFSDECADSAAIVGSKKLKAIQDDESPSGDFSAFAKVATNTDTQSGSAWPQSVRYITTQEVRDLGLNLSPELLAGEGSSTVGETIFGRASMVCHSRFN
jgi:hypothetical protein